MQSQEPPPMEPPVRLGVFTDIQFAWKEDRVVHGACKNVTDDQKKAVRTQYFKRALPKTASAVAALNAADVSVTVQLGDIIDGNSSIELTRSELATVLEVLHPLRAPILHVVGNHCLSAGRSHLLHALQLKHSYYTYKVSPKWAVVVIDTVDMSTAHDDPNVQAEATKYLDTHQGEPNAHEWNGGLGAEQKAWLQQKFELMRQNNMWVIVCGHIPVCLSPEYNERSGYVVWDSQSVADLFSHYSDVVKAYFSGHFHEGDYTLQRGIHYVTFEAILESQSEEGAWAEVELHNDRIVINGHGDVKSRRLHVG